MAEILTDSEIAEIQARAEKATERYVIDYSKGDYARLMDRGHGGIEPRTIAIFDPFQGYRDLSFCENARTDIPRLVASHRALAAQLASIEEREAAVCPEDVGFDEYIRALAAERDELERRNAIQAVTIAEYEGDVASLTEQRDVAREREEESAREFHADIKTLRERIRTLESVCEAAVKAVQSLSPEALGRNPVDGYFYRDELISKLEGAVKHG